MTADRARRNATRVADPARARTAPDALGCRSWPTISRPRHRQDEASSAPPGATDATAPELTDPPELAAVPEDADDTRGLHFRRLAKHPATLIIGGLLVVGALVGGAASGSIAIGGGAAVVLLLLVLLVVYLLASGKAADDFYRAYAEGRTSPGSTASRTCHR